MMQFTKATKSKGKLRLALIGPAGSGKTYTALRVAKELGDKIAFIDTEHGSASKYAGDVADFDVLDLTTFAPATFVDALNAARDAEYTVVVIDSLSHAWMGKEGALEQVDKIAKRSNSGNNFMAWRDVTPMHNALVEAILAYPGHVIATCRAKTEYIIEENERGKKVPRKLGMAPVQRDGMEYEFDVVGDMDFDHNLVVSKSRCTAVSEVGVYKKPGKDLADALKAWLDDGTEVKMSPNDWLKTILKTNKDRDEFVKVCKAEKTTPIAVATQAMPLNVKSRNELFAFVKDGTTKADLETEDTL